MAIHLPVKTVTVSPAFSAVKQTGSTFIAEPGSLRLYPNPAKTSVNVLFDGETDGKVYKLLITDLNGKQVYIKQGIAIKGKNVLAVDVSKLLSAMYVVAYYRSTGSNGEVYKGK